MSETFIDRLKIKGAILLYRLYGKIVLKCLSRHFGVLCVKLQIILLSKYTNKSISCLNKVAVTIATLFLHGYIHESDKALRIEERDLIDNETLAVSNNPELMSLVVNYHRVEALYYSRLLKSDISEEILQKAIQYDNSATTLTPNEFTKLYEAIKKEHKSAKKECNKLKRTLISCERDKLLPKITITPSHITFIASFTTILFLLTGYIYNKFFLGAFGIEVSKFFALSDYIASSIDKIYIAGIAALFGTGSYLWGLYDNVYTSVAESHFKDTYYEKERKRFRTIFFLMLCSLAILSVYAFYNNLPNKHEVLSLFGLFIAMALYHKLPISKFFKNEILISVSYVALIFFISSIYRDVASDIDKIHRNPVEQVKQYEFELNKTFPLNPSTSVLLAGTGEYMFFYDTESKSSYVIPRSAVNWIRPVSPE